MKLYTNNNQDEIQSFSSFDKSGLSQIKAMGGVSLNFIKFSMDRFHEECGRYPTAQEFDSCSYLPSSRTIQRKFGGLIKLRQDLGLEVIDYTKGKPRSIKAKESIEKNKKNESLVYEELLKYFSEPFIHQQKTYYLNTRSDFYIYNKTNNFHVDVLETSTFHNFVGIINIKNSKYRNTKEKVYYVLISKDADSLIKEFNLKRKKYMDTNPIFNHIEVLTLDQFKSKVKEYVPYSML
jgi:hypothetical protein